MNLSQTSSSRLQVLAITVCSLLLVQQQPCHAQSTQPKLAAAASDIPNSLTEAEKAHGWQLLFDGKDPATHWRGYKKTNCRQLG